MRLSLCNEVLRDRPFAEQCAFAAALGYRGLEVAPFTLDEEPHRLPAGRIAGLRRDAAEAGIAITSLHWLLVTPPGLSITAAEAGVRQKTRDVIAGLIDLAAALGATHLVHGSPAQRMLPAGDEDAGRARAIEIFAFAAERAAAAGVTYCIEPLDPGQTNLINTVAEAAEIVRMIGSPALRTMIDICAAARGETESPAELLARWLPTGLIAHLHLNDANRRAPGQGETRFGPILAAVQRASFAGTLAVEPFDYVPDGAGAAAFAIGYLKGVTEGVA
ncbi:MAG: sugar phosphate isomerase/epimerase [Elioraea sp.]|nr:sugar phosphate isomerase/epimerase [Elioraea sp.]